jgi:hypothetical protein
MPTAPTSIRLRCCASWRRGERAYLARLQPRQSHAFHELAKSHRQRGDAQQALRWDLRGMIYERYPSSSSRLPDAVAAQVTPCIRWLRRSSVAPSVAMPTHRSIWARCWKKA